MNKFEIEFTTNLRELKLKKKDVANQLNMTLPTLSSKILNPEKITALDMFNLLNLGFTINIKTIFNVINEKRQAKEPVH